MLKTHNFELYEHLQTRLFTNMTGVPYCSQSHDARHEEANKKAQNMFPGNSLDELDLAFTIVDDIWKLRKEKFSEFGVSDSSVGQSVVPNLDPLVVKMRYALRKSKYLENPTNENKEAKSISDKELHPALNTLFVTAVKQRKTDILNVIRYNDFSEGFRGKVAKIPIFKDDKFNKQSEEELLTMIELLIVSIDDINTQLLVRNVFEDKLKLKEMATLEDFLNDLLDICDSLK